MNKDFLAMYFILLCNTRTSLVPRQQVLLVGILAEYVTHRQNIFRSVETEYLSFILVMHLLAVGYSQTEYLSFI